MRVNRRRLLAGVAATAALALGLTGCGGGRAGVESSTEPGGNKGALIGVAMPTKTSERWIDDGNNVSKKLEELGYKVDLQYANDKVPDQQQQIESQLNKGAKALIIAAIDVNRGDDQCLGSLVELGLDLLLLIRNLVVGVLQVDLVTQLFKLLAHVVSVVDPTLGGLGRHGDPDESPLVASSLGRTLDAGAAASAAAAQSQRQRGRRGDASEKSSSVHARSFR